MKLEHEEKMLDDTGKKTKTNNENEKPEIAVVYGKKGKKEEVVGQQKQVAMSKQSMKLLVVSVAQGFSFDVVEAARAAGGDGAFIVEGRGLGKSEKKFFGLNIEPETEMVFLAVPEKICVKVAKAIYAKCRFTDESRCSVFVLPVSSYFV